MTVASAKTIGRIANWTRASVARPAAATNRSWARSDGFASAFTAAYTEASSSGYASASEEMNEAYSRSGTRTVKAARASETRELRPSRRAIRNTGTAARDIASAPIAWMTRKAVSTSPISHAGAVTIGWSSAGKCAGPPRIRGRPDSAIERPIEE